MRPVWVHDSLTAVIHAIIRSICSCVSPRGRPDTATDTRNAADRTQCKGRS